MNDEEKFSKNHMSHHKKLNLIKLITMNHDLKLNLLN